MAPGAFLFRTQTTHTLLNKTAVCQQNSILSKSKLDAGLWREITYKEIQEDLLQKNDELKIHTDVLGK